MSLLLLYDESDHCVEDLGAKHVSLLVSRLEKMRGATASVSLMGILVRILFTTLRDIRQEKSPTDFLSPTRLLM